MYTVITRSLGDEHHGKGVSKVPPEFRVKVLSGLEVRERFMKKVTYKGALNNM